MEVERNHHNVDHEPLMSRAFRVESPKGSSAHWQSLLGSRRTIVEVERDDDVRVSSARGPRSNSAESSNVPSTIFDSSCACIKSLRN